MVKTPIQVTFISQLCPLTGKLDAHTQTSVWNVCHIEFKEATLEIGEDCDNIV